MKKRDSTNKSTIEGIYIDDQDQSWQAGAYVLIDKNDVEIGEVIMTEDMATIATKGRHFWGRGSSRMIIDKENFRIRITKMEVN